MIDGLIIKLHSSLINQRKPSVNPTDGKKTFRHFDWLIPMCIFWHGRQTVGFTNDVEPTKPCRVERFVTRSRWTTQSVWEVREWDVKQSVMSSSASLPLSFHSLNVQRSAVINGKPWGVCARALLCARMQMCARWTGCKCEGSHVAPFCSKCHVACH